MVGTGLERMGSRRGLKGSGSERLCTSGLWVLDVDGCQQAVDDFVEA
jgi:hypothetical protein